MLKRRGFTIIELMVTIAVLSILLMVGLPSYSIWMHNMRIRGAAEAVQNGLQIARATAIARNTQVSLVFPADGNLSYMIYSVISPTNMPADFRAPGAEVDIYRRYNQQEGSSNASVTMTPAGSYMVTFGSLGQRLSNPDGSGIPTQIDVGSAVSGDPAIRPLRIQISAGGATKTCDPAVTDAADPRKC